MSFYDDLILPYCIDLSCGAKALVPKRRAATAGLYGDVLEIGFGSGLNLPHVPPAVTRVLAVDPSGRARHIAKQRIAAASCPVQFVGLDAGRIQADTASADCALSTFTLCTVPDPAAALAEVRRVLKPGGALHFVEHGKASDPGVARWQARLNGLQRKVAGGCELTRDMPALLQAAGFTLSTLDEGYFPGVPRTHGYLFTGAAAAP